MPEWVKKYLTPPHLTDEVRSQKAAMLYVFSLCGVGVELVYLVIFVFTVSDMGYGPLRSGLIIIWAASTLWMVRRDWVQWASWQFSLVGWGIFSPAGFAGPLSYG